MEKFELIAPCHFGMEAVLKREILDLGYEITKVEDGKVTFEADAQGIADANIFRRKRPETRTAARFFRYSAREMFHTKVQVKHYILWSVRPPYLQKILENLTFVPFLPLSPGFRRS